jgi:hypothetical protein
MPGRYFDDNQDMSKGINETSWKGYRHIRKKNYSLYYSCNPDSAGHLGTSFLVMNELEKNIQY